MSKKEPQEQQAHPAWHMRRALRLAEQGKGWTLPNPMVGAVLVKDGRRIGEGFHHSCGAAHAEIEALASAQESVEGATLYVTLEPCCHQGKTPPCTEAILSSGISKVIVACEDPSEKVAGKGIDLLRKAGLTVEVGLLGKEAEELNRFFFTFHRKKRPFITLKAALSLDGKISEAAGKETTLSGAPAARFVHALRHEHQAILVGAGTVLSDDPHLGVRHIEGRDPLRIILEGKKKLPKKAQIFRDENVLLLKEKSVSEILDELYKKEITSVLVEGGQHVFESFLEAKVVDAYCFILAPVFLGEKALPFAHLDSALQLKNPQTTVLGKDLVIEAQAEF